MRRWPSILLLIVLAIYRLKQKRKAGLIPGFGMVRAIIVSQASRRESSSQCDGIGRQANVVRSRLVMPPPHSRLRRCLNDTSVIEGRGQRF